MGISMLGSNKIWKCCKSKKFIRKHIWFETNMSIISRLALMTALRRKLLFTSEFKWDFHMKWCTQVYENFI